MADATKWIRERVILGTVQFGLPYGRRRRAGQLEEVEVQRVLDAAWDLGVRSFDTAEGYGDAIPRLHRWIRSRRLASQVSIVTKVRTDEAFLVAERVKAALSLIDGTVDPVLLTH